MTRGNVVIAAEKGSFAGKPRPWVVIQNALFLDQPSSITVCAVGASSQPAAFRVPVTPTAANGLDEPSLILADKVITLRSDSIHKVVGTVDDLTIARLDQALRDWLDL